MSISVRVRPYEPSDADDMCAAAIESVREIEPWMPWCHANYGRADALGWVEATTVGRAKKALFDFAVLSDGMYVGGCGINRINWMERVANLGYWVRTSATGQGIATTAARQVLDWAFSETTLNRIEIVVACKNLPSQRVAEKLGAHRDAVLRERTFVNGQPADAVMFSVLRSD